MSKFVATIQRMMSKLLFAAAGVVALVVSVMMIAQANAAVPQIINYQGKLHDANGNAVADGTYYAKFVIYDAATNGTCLWTALGACDTGDYATTTVSVVNGVFSVKLGDTGHNSIATSTINFNTDSLYLGVTIRGTAAEPVYDNEMTPRKRLTSAPYAFNADTIDGIHATSTAAVANYLLALDDNGNLNLFNNGVYGARSTTTEFVLIGNDATLGNLDRANGDLYVSGDAEFDGTVYLQGAVISSVDPTLPHTFLAWTQGVANSNVADSVFYVNPGSAVADSNLIGAAVNGSVQFIVDAEGDIFANSLTLTGSQNVGLSNISTLIVENNSFLGDGSNSDWTHIRGSAWIETNKNLGSSSSTALVISQAGTGNILEVTDGSTYGGGNRFFTIDAGGTASTTKLYVQGRATTTERLVLGTTNPTNDFGKLWIGGDAFISGNATTTGSLHIGTTSLVLEDGSIHQTTGNLSIFADVGSVNINRLIVEDKATSTLGFWIGSGGTPNDVDFADGDLYVQDDAEFDGTVYFAHASFSSTDPSQPHIFGAWAPGVADSRVDDAALFVNPTSAVADSNLIGASVNGSVKFLLDAEGDIFANSLTLSGSQTVGQSTISTLIVENNSYLGDAANSDWTHLKGTAWFEANKNSDVASSTALVISQAGTGNLLEVTNGGAYYNGGTRYFTIDNTGTASTTKFIVQGNATTTGRLVVGGTATNNFADLWVDGDSFFSGNATTTGNVNIGGYASTTNLVLGNDGTNLGTYNDIFVSNNELFFNATQITGTGGYAGAPGAWQWNGFALTPTSTSAGIFVNASSTINANFQVNGNATTTGRTVFGTTQPTNNFGKIWVGGDAFISGNATTTGSLHIGSASLRLEDGSIYQSTGNLTVSTASGLVSVSDDLTVTGSATTTSRLVVGSTNPTSDDLLWVGGNSSFSGNIGIGRSPSSGVELDVYSASAKLLLEASSGNPEIHLRNSGGIDWQIIHDGSELEFRREATEYLTLGAGTLTVTGTIESTSNATVGGDLTVNGGDLTVNISGNPVFTVSNTGLVRSHDALQVDGVSAFTGTSTFNGDIHIKDTVDLFTQDITVFLIGADSGAVWNGQPAGLYWSNADIGNGRFELRDASGTYFNLAVGYIFGIGSNITDLNATNITAGTLAVARGGTGANTLTGLVRGNGTGAFTAITDSSTVGQVLRVTGASTYAWGALDLADSDAITGDLPLSNLAQASGIGVLGRSADSAGDYALLSAGIDGQVLRRSGTTLGFGSISLANTISVTGTLAGGNGGTGITSFGASGRIPYANSTTALTTSANLTFSGTQLSVSSFTANTSGHATTTRLTVGPTGGWNNDTSYVTIGASGFGTGFQSSYNALWSGVLNYNGTGNAAAQSLGIFVDRDYSNSEFTHRGYAAVIGMESSAISGGTIGYLGTLNQTGISDNGTQNSFTGGTTNFVGSESALRWLGPSSSGASIGASATINYYGFRDLTATDLGTTGSIIKYGIYTAIGGTADANYGGYVEAGGATTNYGLYAKGISNFQTTYAIRGEVNAASIQAGTNATIYGGSFSTANNVGTSYGVLGSVTNSSSSGNAYGGYFAAGGADVGYAGFFDASGNGNGNYAIYTDGGEVRIGTLGTNGPVYSNTNILTNVNPSSREYKDNIQSIDLQASRILNLIPKSFIWKNNGDEDFGYIAEEVKEIVPELYLDDGTTKGFDVAKLPFYIIEVLKTQQQQINQLMGQSGLPTDGAPVIIQNNYSATESLVVQKASAFYGTIYVKGEAGFESKVTFKKDVNIAGKLYLSKDQVGSATVKAGEKEIEVKFDKPFITEPILSATLLGNSENPIFVNWLIADKSVTGFKILISEIQDVDVTFDWIALGLYTGENEQFSLPPLITEITLSHDEVQLNETISLMATATDPDTDESELTYTWSTVGDVGSFTNAENKNAFWTVHDEAVTEVTFVVKVSDGKYTISKTKTITIFNPEEPQQEPVDEESVASDEENQETEDEEIVTDETEISDAEEADDTAASTTTPIIEQQSDSGQEVITPETPVSNEPPAVISDNQSEIEEGVSVEETPPAEQVNTEEL